MKKSLLRFMLLVTGLLLGVNVAWAGDEWSIDFATLGSDYADKTAVTISDKVETIGGTDMGTCSVSGSALNANFVLQTGTTWLMRTTNGLYQGNGGGRAMGMLNCTAGQIITIIGTGNPNPSTNATLKSQDGSTYKYTVTADGNVKFTPARYLYFTSISVENPSASSVKYTIKYVDEAGTEIKDASEGDGEPEAAIMLTDVEKASFFNADKTKKYIYKSDDAEGKTIASDGTTVIIITFREAQKYTYAVKDNLDNEVAVGSEFEGEDVSFGVPYYVFKDGKFYEKPSLSVGKLSYGQGVLSAISANTEILVTYTEEANSNTVFYAEAENLVGVTPYEDGYTQIRMSNGKAGYYENQTAFVKLPMGKYTLTTATRSGNTEFFAGAVGNGSKIGEVTSSGAVTVTTSDEFTLKVPTDIYTSVGSATAYFDYVIIRKTGDVNPLFTLKGEAGKSATVTMGVYDAYDIYGVDFGDGVIVTDSVGWHNGGVRDAEGYDPTDPVAVPSAKEGTTHDGATKFTGTVGESGIITVYGTSATWLLDCQDGVVPTDYSQAGLAKLHEFKLSGTADESISLPEWSQLTQFSLSNSKTKSLDVSKVTALTSLSVVNTSMAENDMMLEGIDLSKNTALENLILGGDSYKAGVLKTLDLSANTALKQIIAANQELESIVLPEGANLTNGLNVAKNKLTALDLSKLGSVKNLRAFTNQIESLDLSKLTEGSDLYIKENKLTELNVPVSVANLEAQSNQLTSATIANATKTCKLENNAFTLATLPAQPAGLSTKKKTQNFTYAPQAAMTVDETVTELDLSSQLTVEKGELDPADYASYLTATTTYSFVTATGTALVEGTDYEVTEPGKFKFLKAQAEKVHAEMLNAAFPKFTADVPFKTTEFTVVPAPQLILTFNAPANTEVSLTFGVYDTEDTYGVDFGDGNVQTKTVGVNNAGPVDPETGQTTSATVFTGTVAGDGTIKVYGNNDVWYLISSGAMPTALDQAKLMNVQQMTITGANVESVELPAYSQMTQFNFNNSPVKTLDVTKVTTLTSLSVDNTTQSQYAPALESIDLSANTELTYLKIIGNATNKGKLAAIDLSNNTKLANVYLQDNAIKTATMPAGAALTFLNLQNNELEALDLSALTSITNAWLENNQLKSLSLGNVTKVCKFENNALTLATIPAQPAGMNSKTKTKNFTYAPQAALQVADLFLVNDELDLSAQAIVAKGELNPEAVGEAAAYGSWLEDKATVFTVKTAGEIPATLVEGTDYNIEGGKITFLKAQADKVYVEMTNEAFPKFTGANAFKTTEFAVMVLEDITIDATDIAEGDITTAIATKTAGKLVKNITINLAAETVYTVSATIEVPAGLTINGNGATIDGSALTTPMIQMSATPTVAQNEKEAYLSDGIIVKDVTVTGLKYQFIYGNKVKALLAKVEVENSVIGIDGTNKKTVFDFNGGGNASEILINNSTIYANPSNEQNGGLFSSQSGHGSIQDLGSEKQLFAITNSTIYNIAYGKTTNSQRRNNTAGMEFQVENSIIVNSGKNGQFIVGLNGGSANAAQTYTASNNVFNFDGADVSANEQAKVQEKIATFEMTSIVGVVTFTDAANGNFAGNVELPFGATEPTTKPGDPRWTLIFKQATGIQSVKAVDLNDAVIYNLNGARVSKPGKGLYIINGNKVVIK